MRKIALIAVLFVFLSVCLFAGNKFFVSAGAAAVYPADKRFKDLYGSLQFAPELRAGYYFYENFYLWLGCSFFSASCTIPVILEEAKVNQHFLTLGAGWETPRGRRLQSDFFAGLVLAGFKERAMDETFKDSELGFELGTALRYFFDKNIFAGAALSYSEARASLSETEINLGGRRLLGGLRLTVNLGICF